MPYACICVATGPTRRYSNTHPVYEETALPTLHVPRCLRLAATLHRFIRHITVVAYGRFLPVQRSMNSPRTSRAHRRIRHLWAQLGCAHRQAVMSHKAQSILSGEWLLTANNSHGGNGE